MSTPGQTTQWQEEKHARGKPENAGQFAPKGQGGGGGEESGGAPAKFPPLNSGGPIEAAGSAHWSPRAAASPGFSCLTAKILPSRVLIAPGFAVGSRPIFVGGAPANERSAWSVFLGRSWPTMRRILIRFCCRRSAAIESETADGEIIAIYEERPVSKPALPLGADVHPSSHFEKSDQQAGP